LLGDCGMTIHCLIIGLTAGTEAYFTKGQKFNPISKKF
jgi:hypothetical protein